MRKKRISTMPEYYTHPERFFWFHAETNHGFKRTFAKTEKGAIKKLEKHGLKVSSIQQQPKLQ